MAGCRRDRAQPGQAAFGAGDVARAKQLERMIKYEVVTPGPFGMNEIQGLYAERTCSSLGISSERIFRQLVFSIFCTSWVREVT